MALLDAECVFYTHSERYKSTDENTQKKTKNPSNFDRNLKQVVNSQLKTKLDSQEAGSYYQNTQTKRKKITYKANGIFQSFIETLKKLRHDTAHQTQGNKGTSTENNITGPSLTSTGETDDIFYLHLDSNDVTKSSKSKLYNTGQKSSNITDITSGKNNAELNKHHEISNYNVTNLPKQSSKYIKSFGGFSMMSPGLSSMFNEIYNTKEHTQHDKNIEKKFNTVDVTLLPDQKEPSETLGSTVLDESSLMVSDSTIMDGYHYGEDPQGIVRKIDFNHSINSSVFQPPPLMTSKLTERQALIISESVQKVPEVYSKPKQEQSLPNSELPNSEMPNPELSNLELPNPEFTQESLLKTVKTTQNSITMKPESTPEPSLTTLGLSLNTPLVILKSSQNSPPLISESTQISLLKTTTNSNKQPEQEHFSIPTPTSETKQLLAFSPQTHLPSTTNLIQNQFQTDNPDSIHPKEISQEQPSDDISDFNSVQYENNEHSVIDDDDKEILGLANGSSNTTRLSVESPEDAVFSTPIGWTSDHVMSNRTFERDARYLSEDSTMYMDFEESGKSFDRGSTSSGIESRKRIHSTLINSDHHHPLLVEDADISSGEEEIQTIATSTGTTSKYKHESVSFTRSIEDSSTFAEVKLRRSSSPFISIDIDISNNTKDEPQVPESDESLAPTPSKINYIKDSGLPQSVTPFESVSPPRTNAPRMIDNSSGGGGGGLTRRRSSSPFEMIDA